MNAARKTKPGSAPAGAGSVAVCDQLRAVDKSRLIRSDGRLASDDLRAVQDGVRQVLEL